MSLGKRNTVSTDVPLRIEHTNPSHNCMGVVLASFGSGLPTPVQNKSADFNVIRPRKQKLKLLVCEDSDNHILYFGKNNVIQTNTISEPKLAVGIVDPSKGGMKLVPISERFNMEQLCCRMEERAAAGVHQSDNDDTTQSGETITTHQKLIDTFGSKFMAASLRKRKNMNKTREATLQAIKRMDTATFVVDGDDDTNGDTAAVKKEESNSDNDSESDSDYDPIKDESTTADAAAATTNSTTSAVNTVSSVVPSSVTICDVPPTIAAAAVAGAEEDKETKETKTKLKKEKKEKIFESIFDHDNSDSVYSVFEFPSHKKSKHASKIFDLSKIIPPHLWDTIDVSATVDWWVTNPDDTKLFEFTKHCFALRSKIPQTMFDHWCKALILYESIVHFLKEFRPSHLEFEVWNSLQTALLPSDKPNKSKKSSHKPKHKKRRITLSKRTKMRIVGVLCLLALRVGIWKLSMKSVEKIGTDLGIPIKVMSGIFMLLGCNISDENVQLIAPLRVRKPSFSLDGRWWM